MTASPEKGFDAPPLWEIAVSAFTSTPAIDIYDIKGLHDLYRDTLPKAERQLPVLQLPVAGFVGGPPPIATMETGLSPRWWFISEDRSDVFQAQENFIASNWRRENVTPGDKFEYPGFAYILDQARNRIERLREHRESSGATLPEPAACELLYDNLLPLIDRDGNKMLLSDVMAEYQRAEPKPVLGFQCQWLEKIDGVDDDGKSTMQVQMSVVAMPRVDDEPLPILRLQFTAGAVRESWDDAFIFFEAAHAYIRHRLMVLTTEKAHTTWLPK